MATKHNFAGLDWVVGEIGETLNEARQALEDHASNPQDVERLTTCLQRIHQVNGSLQIIEFFGASLLTEEMEAMLRGMISGSVLDLQPARESLMQAILRLPAYLEQVKLRRQDNPVALLSTLNQLRQLRGVDLLPRSQFFDPDITPAHRISGEPNPAQADDAQFKAILNKLRQMFRYAAGAVVKDVDTSVNLAYLQKAAARLQSLTSGTARQPLWDISLALLEGLVGGQVAMSEDVKILLRDLDREIQHLATRGVSALDSFSADDIIKNVLFLLATAAAGNSRIDRLAAQYHLSSDTPLGDRTRLARDESDASGPDPDTLRTVVGALNEELALIKEALDACAFGNDKTALERALPVMRRVADTLSVLGVNDLRVAILDQAQRLEQAQANDQLSREKLEQVAEQIVATEHRLAVMARSNISSSEAAQQSSHKLHLDEAQTALLRESSDNLEQVKNAVIEYIASQWDRTHLEEVPDLLSGIVGGLDIIPLQRPAEILRGCRSYIQSDLLDKGVTPDWKSLDSLADAIAGVEYYLERISLDGDGDDDLLLLAQQSMDTLGYSVPDKVDVTEETASHSDRWRDIAAQVAAGEQVAAADADSTADSGPLFDSPQDIVTADSELEFSDFDFDDEVELDDHVAQTALSGAIGEDDDERPEAGVTEPAALQPDTAEEELPELAADSSSDEIDDDIIEIFIEEAGEVLEAIDEFFPQWAEDFNNRDALAEVRRAFHTLKGSGRMVGANIIGELCWSVENLLNRIKEGTREPHVAQVELINRVRATLPRFIEAFEHKQPNPAPQLAARLAHWGDELAAGNIPAPLTAAGASEETLPVSEAATEEVAEEATVAEEEDANAVLWEIFAGEAHMHLQTVQEFIAEMEQFAPIFTPPSESMQRALHTLKGSARMAEIDDVAQLATPLEHFTKELRSYQIDINYDILQLFKDAVNYVSSALDELKAGRLARIDKLEQFQARVAELHDMIVGPHAHKTEQTLAVSAVNPQLLAIFMAEEMNLLIDADELLDEWQRQPQVPERLQEMIGELHTLAHGADQANLPDMANLSQHLAAVYSAADPDLSVLRQADFDCLLGAHERLLDMVDAVAASQNQLPVEAGLWSSLQQLARRLEEASAAAEAEAEIAMSSEASDASEVPVFEPEEVSERDYDLQVEEDLAEQELDEEIIAIFVEEADELMEEIEQALHEWSEDWQHVQSAESLKRVLHTYKGGARLAGLGKLGDIAHDFESDIIHSGQGQLGGDFFARMYSYQDRLLKGLEQVRDRVPVDEAASVTKPPQPQPIDEQAAPVEEPVTPRPEPASPAEAASSVVPFKSRDRELPFTRPERTPAAPVHGEVAGGGSAITRPLQARRSAPQEVVKVPAELLEQLVNLAGETSISRGRMEEQMTEQLFAIEEMQGTITRLQGQLRRLDIETQAQILFRQEQLAESEDFDPLEMDRYSALQQLSRSLIESASDLVDLKTTLLDKVRDTETLLLQQSRINTDLQEGLMRTRMVPFSRLVPRLRRIIRQVSTELDKSVNLNIDNPEGELDRTVMERMVAPLEHMLRNAVDHGIELPAERRQQGKPETGQIQLSLSREGGDVLLRLTDDGRGIDLNRVREKAIERGLMAPEAVLSDNDIMQFILHAGFTTAASVTQISGRGVGLDVVHSEIKQMGGSMSIRSALGEGTEFSIRLPFTVSVNRALMVRLGDDRYAIPLNTIEGIVRVSPFELEHYYQDERAMFEYAGEQYQVRYLGSLLDSDARPKLDGQSMPLPVVLVRTTEHTVAIQVDLLMGSREIVVKSLGPQLAGVSGVSGATVMGDGSVVVILDPHAMIRREAALAHASMPSLDAIPAREEREVKTVMVVDDSVTVRKVTGRFLEREGYEVLTAKDGADALLQLQDHIPDIMLLDIEMPRMDGFEVAKTIRQSARLADIPIIMITSRTGDKHRERALSLGVNEYMGKPYQEEILLRNIQGLTGELLAPSDTAGLPSGE